MMSIFFLLADGVEDFCILSYQISAVLVFFEEGKRSTF